VPSRLVVKLTAHFKLPVWREGMRAWSGLAKGVERKSVVNGRGQVGAIARAPLHRHSSQEWLFAATCPQSTGHRHAFMCRYKVGFGKDGRVSALDATLYSNVGNSMVRQCACKRASLQACKCGTGVCVSRCPCASEAELKQVLS